MGSGSWTGPSGPVVGLSGGSLIGIGGFSPGGVGLGSSFCLSKWFMREDIEGAQVLDSTGELQLRLGLGLWLYLVLAHQHAQFFR